MAYVNECVQIMKAMSHFSDMRCMLRAVSYYCHLHLTPEDRLEPEEWSYNEYENRLDRLTPTYRFEFDSIDRRVEEFDYILDSIPVGDRPAIVARAFFSQYPNAEAGDLSDELYDLAQLDCVIDKGCLPEDVLRLPYDPLYSDMEKALSKVQELVDSLNINVVPNMLLERQLKSSGINLLESEDFSIRFVVYAQCTVTPCIVTILTDDNDKLLLIMAPVKHSFCKAGCSYLDYEIDLHLNQIGKELYPGGFYSLPEFDNDVNLLLLSQRLDSPNDVSKAIMLLLSEVDSIIKPVEELIKACQI